MQKVFEKYRSDPEVAFVMVSIDDDPARLARYMEERKFALTVARTDPDAAAKAFRVTDVPATFYIDRQGVIRYEARGLETHGDSAERAAWYIEELKGALEERHLEKPPR